MIKKDIKDLIKKTSEATGVPYYMVKAIAESQSQYLEAWFKNPDKPEVYLENLGTFYPRIGPLNAMLRKQLIPKMREGRATDHDYERFRFWWKYRKKLIEYLISRHPKRKVLSYGLRKPVK